MCGTTDVFYGSDGVFQLEQIHGWGGEASRVRRSVVSLAFLVYTPVCYGAFMAASTYQQTGNVGLSLQSRAIAGISPSLFTSLGCTTYIT